MGLYEFRADDAERFASAVGARTKHKNRQLEFAFCPYCRGGGKDKGTFYISMETGQFECKRAGCGRKGNMITLARDFADRFELSSDITRYYNTNDFNNRFKRFKKSEIVVKDKAIEYCDSRGISEEVVRRYELTVKDDSTLVFPFRDDKGEIRFIKYRNMEYKKGESKGSKEWCEADCMPILFGMYQCNLQNKTLIITEGQMDSLSLATAGIENAVSVPTGANGFTWVPHCWNWLQNFETLIVFGDCENGHITLADEMLKRFNGTVKIVRQEDYFGHKDANDMLNNLGPDYLKIAVEKAEAPRDTRLTELSRVERVDIEKMPAISTFSKELDRYLSGGFHFGQLIVLTGNRGKGKSTLMGQFILDALAADTSTLVYSAELVDFYFRNWLDRQLIGRADITDSDYDMANKFYGGRMFLYNNRIIPEGKTETESLLEIIEKAITQYSVRFICIDNLMTAIELSNGENQWQAQSNFVGKLANICRQYNVIIVLVAHPRKASGWKTTDENDDIAGSGDITNKADIVLRYQEPIKLDRYPDITKLPNRELSILKNRLTGKITGDFPIPLWFDSASKRITEHQGWFGYEWLPENATETTYVEDEELPFLDALMEFDDGEENI